MSAVLGFGVPVGDEDGPGPVIGRGDNDVIPNMATVAQTRVSDQWVATRLDN